MLLDVNYGRILQAFAASVCSILQRNAEKTTQCHTIFQQTSKLMDKHEWAI